METINSIEEAQEWFMNHSSGAVLCIRGDKQKECDCYPVANEFFSKVI